MQTTAVDDHRLFDRDVEATPCMDTLYTSNFNKVSFTRPLRCAVKGTHVNGSSEMH